MLEETVQEKRAWGGRSVRLTRRTCVWAASVASWFDRRPRGRIHVLPLAESSGLL